MQDHMHDKGTDKLMRAVEAAPGFTPGPWRVEEVCETGQRVVVFEACDICSIEYCNSEANARLIAAAPCMYAALLECVTDDGACCMNTGQKSRRLKAITDIARAALAKAEGRTL